MATSINGDLLGYNWESASKSFKYQPTASRVPLVGSPATLYSLFIEVTHIDSVTGVCLSIVVALAALAGEGRTGHQGAGQTHHTQDARGSVNFASKGTWLLN